MSRCLAFLGCCAVALGAGLTDNPIIGSEITYLDSSATQKWTATASPTGVAACAFAPDLDWKPADGTNSGTEHTNVASQEACCVICSADAGCVAAVYVPAPSNSCWTKTAAQAAGGSYARPGRVSCVPNATSADDRDDDTLEISATVPGDLLTDLQQAGQIGDPLYEKNWLNSSIWNERTWTYKTEFSAPQLLLGSGSGNGGSGGARTQLVFDGIKMGAVIKVNGVVIGNATDQFLRHTFDIEPATHFLTATGNTLEVVFSSRIDVGGRFMACTGGWDWAPYTNTFQGDAHTFTKGIWKSVYLVSVPAESVMITHVVPQIRYSGEYPVTPLVDGSHGGFAVDVRVHIRSSSQRAQTLHLSQQATLTTSWGAAAVSQTVSVPPGDSSFTLSTTASADQIKLWWPAGMGAQPLYNVTVSVGGRVASRRVGFRYFALVTGNDTDAAWVANAKDKEGTESHGMYFRINGAVMWSKGANMIPMEELEGRMNADAHRVLVESAVNGGMNTLRVWGGGMFLPDAWYDACDELGIVVYHDMQYAQSGHAPAVTADQDAELRHQVRRLASHPSIVVWDGCNECRVVMNTPTGIYATFVMTVVAEEDKSRAVWPSCPALGWTGGVRKLDAIPNGNKLTTPPSGKSIETHGPYQHGTGFPAVNGASNLQLFSANIPITVSPNSTGPAFDNVFASEFGAVVMSSFESMSPTLAPEHWGLHAGQPSDTCTGGFASKCEGPNVMAERNYPCDSLIDVYFGQRDDSYFNQTGEAVFKKQLYQCMLSQALEMKSNIETRRSQNQLGCIVWQYNEIWPTGGWGSIEYGTPVKGQVLGGRWKPLQYFYKRSIFADVMATCGGDGTCFVKNDRAGRAFMGTVTIEALEFATGKISTMATKDVSLPVGAGVTEFFQVDLSSVNGTTHLLLVSATDADADGAEQSRNELALAVPGKMLLPAATVTATVASAPSPDGSVLITLDASATALYVTLTTLAHGRFSDNAFAMAPGKVAVSFIPMQTSAPVDISLLKASLRIEHLQQNQH